MAKDEAVTPIPVGRHPLIGRRVGYAVFLAAILAGPWLAARWGLGRPVPTATETVNGALAAARHRFPGAQALSVVPTAQDGRPAYQIVLRLPPGRLERVLVGINGQLTVAAGQTSRGLAPSTKSPGGGHTPIALPVAAALKAVGGGQVVGVSTDDAQNTESVIILMQNGRDVRVVVSLATNSVMQVSLNTGDR
ncbi:MAG: hypothetical protein M0Z53_12445 [Thermaerobacter sp.]|nr:hypothetical protein [Thermaerobacter sp.]